MRNADLTCIRPFSIVPAMMIAILSLAPRPARADEAAPPETAPRETAEPMSGWDFDTASADLRSTVSEQLTFANQRLAEWKVILGGGAMIAPKYEGSNELDVQPIPFFAASFGEWVKVDPRAVSISLYELGNLRFSGQVGYDRGRKEDDSDKLRGLGDIDVGAVVGGTVQFGTDPFDFYASFSQIIGGSDGIEVTFGGDFAQTIDRFRLSAGLSTTWADGDYMQTFFGVTPEQSARSGLPAYSIGAGFKRVDLDLAVTYAVSEHWVVRGQVGLGYLLGDVADSPIVQEEFQPSVTFAVGYRF
ncbi:MipA/OmpV family protein [Ancylobacter sp. MQZ15Z-1]|uniref:MipA/OmpV family protein n=1 Tax=Ancylobacter mangrovi TaxID=2972472 RepID=A0A9X2PE14_9HYPH|nr:MipA/OmpV family protein [Ancylobacter mangrovi]MCS0496961.1 MipA/OmpV family protein [Ancylobacter mangrovi]